MRVDELGIDDLFTVNDDPQHEVWEVRCCARPDKATVFCVACDDFGQRINGRGFLQLSCDVEVTEYKPLNPRKKADRQLERARHCLRDGLCIADIWLTTLDDRDNVLPDDYVPRTGLLILERKARAWAACVAVVGEWTEDELAASIVHVRNNTNPRDDGHELQLRLRMYSHECAHGRPKEFGLLYDLRNAKYIHEVPHVADDQVVFGYTREQALVQLEEAYQRLTQ